MIRVIKAAAPTLIALSSAALIITSCTQQNSASRGTTPGVPVVRVKADQSIKPAMQELMEQYQQIATVQMQISFCPSGDLQLDLAGDSIDVYLLANDAAAAATDSSLKKTLAYAIPCIIVPDLNPALVADIKDLLKPDLRIGIADPAKDILGGFALELLKANKLYDAVQARLVILGPTAMEVADCAARREVDAAIGWTLFPNWVQGSVDVVLLNAGEIPRVAAVTARRALNPIDSTAAVNLMNYLSSDRSLEIFRKWGYLTSPSAIEAYAPIAAIGGAPIY